MSRRSVLPRGVSHGRRASRMAPGGRLKSESEIKPNWHLTGMVGGGSAFREMELPYTFKNDDDQSVAIYFDDSDFTFSNFGYDRAFVASNGVVIPRRPGESDMGFVSYTMQNLEYYEDIFSPYWADHDTRGPTAGEVQYGIVPVGGVLALVVIWDDVAIYPASTASLDNRRSRFQLIAYADGWVEFNYHHIDLDIGSASSSQGPIVGLHLPPAETWEHEQSDKLIDTTAGNDPVYGGYLQGTSGFTDNGAYALRYDSNCGIPGRLMFGVGGQGS